MQCWVILAKGMTPMFLELVDSEREMTEDRLWFIGWPGLDSLRKLKFLFGQGDVKRKTRVAKCLPWAHRQSATSQDTTSGQ